jgi:hypothetical protein
MHGGAPATINGTWSATGIVMTMTTAVIMTETVILTGTVAKP